MMGLPGETDEDIVAIANLADHTLEVAREVVPKEQRGGISVSVSVSVFIPKAQTPFQWCGQTPKDEVKRRQQLCCTACATARCACITTTPRPRSSRRS